MWLNLLNSGLSICSDGDDSRTQSSLTIHVISPHLFQTGKVIVATKTWNDLQPPKTIYNHLQPPQKNSTTTYNHLQPPQKHLQPLANNLKPSKTRYKCLK